jgi:hypothetical protein
MIFLLLDNEHQAQEQSGIGQSTYTSHAISKAAVPACPGALQKFELQIPIIPSTCAIGCTLNLLNLSVYRCFLREHSNDAERKLTISSIIIHH